ncbi:MAG: hypothetical protein J5842_00775 [Lachnospiraceae bacterium]|nr:hypothetical protein [Lachnospiraceae bacterium]
MNEEKMQMMKMIGRKMALRMGILMSFFLALTGTLTSGHFTVPGFILSFIMSSILSIIIGLIVPIGLINAKLGQSLKLEPGSLKARCIESCVSDLIYTPVLTLAMTSFAYVMIKKQSGGMAQIPYLPMFLKSLIICFVVGYILIFVFTPLLLKSLLPQNPGDES